MLTGKEKVAHSVSLICEHFSDLTRKKGRVLIIVSTLSDLNVLLDELQSSTLIMALKIGIHYISTTFVDSQVFTSNYAAEIIIIMECLVGCIKIPGVSTIINAGRLETSGSESDITEILENLYPNTQIHLLFHSNK